MNTIQKDIQLLTEEIEKIKDRNKRVESNKAWETSWTRRIVIATITYFLISILMISLNVPNPFLNAIIPAISFLLSTASLDMIKNWWIEQKKLR